VRVLPIEKVRSDYSTRKSEFSKEGWHNARIGKVLNRVSGPEFLVRLLGAWGGPKGAADKKRHSGVGERGNVEQPLARTGITQEERMKKGRAREKSMVTITRRTEIGREEDGHPGKSRGPVSQSCAGKTVGRCVWEDSGTQ